MTGLRRLRRSVRCHLKHGTRCPHIERHSLHRPRLSRRMRKQEAAEEMAGRHAAAGH
ncbi:MAG: hypothetical protein FWD95_07395 [Nocardioidaceae bacterium]|nr:hypothetical protein [Nocardioidaceae bacterium]